MQVFEMVVIIVFLGISYAAFEQWQKTKRAKFDQKTEDPELQKKLKKQEERINNLESIILEMEKEKKFRDLDK